MKTRVFSMASRLCTGSTGALLALSSVAGMAQVPAAEHAVDEEATV